jgi:hypothetical protein
MNLRFSLAILKSELNAFFREKNYVPGDRITIRHRCVALLCINNSLSRRKLNLAVKILEDGTQIN